MGKFLALAVVIAGVILSPATYNKAFAQETGQVTVLLAEHQKSHKQILFDLGKRVRYKTLTSKHFEKGRITGITDSTISFENKELGNVIIPHKDLVAFMIPRSAGRRVAGSILIVVAGILGYGIALNPAQGDLAFINLIAAASAAAGIVGGIALMNPKKINLGKSWQLKTSKSSELKK